MPPTKLPFDDWVNSMSFMIDDDFDNQFFQSIHRIVQHINQNCSQFSSNDSLESYLISEHNGIERLTKLKALIALIGLSEERLKRVSSLVRSKYYGESFNTEWNINRICNKIHEEEDFRQIIIDFFVHGRDSVVGTSFPSYYMKNFRLTEEDFIEDLKQESYVERILSDREITKKYSNAVGDHVEKEIVQHKLDEYENDKHLGLTYDTQKEFPLLNKNIDILIPNVDIPKLLIEISYMITTGSGQSKRADQLVSYYSLLMQHNANHPENTIKMINYCDGLGWMGRQRDLKRIYDSSDYVINQSNLHLVDNILAMHIN